ncbi:MAG: hypothetical protein KDA28_11815, partial [Phycisphaerales bacterium]|nr:hypothetical protein [Phycisphaerales bacterium]
MLEGAYGAMPYASLIHLERYESTRVVGETWVLGGLTTTHGYAVQIITQDEIGQDVRTKITDFYEKGIAYDGDLRDPEWTDEEIEERWKRDFPKRLVDEDARIRAIRSKHYVIIGDSSGAKKFAKIMDEHYERIREKFPFEEIEGRRLLPIFLFRDRESYLQFCVEYTGQTREQAERSGGHAWKDYYATSYDAPGDTVHIHEATHQIFGNRLFLDGGGSWFQEGSAVFMEAVYDKSTRRQAINFADDAVEDGRYERFRPFMLKRNLLQDSVGSDAKGDDMAGRAYTQAGTMMEFVLMSDATKEKAMEYVHAVGALAPNDVTGVERVIKRLWNLDLDGFEKLYLEYWEDPV